MSGTLLRHTFCRVLTGPPPPPLRAFLHLLLPSMPPCGIGLHLSRSGHLSFDFCISGMQALLDCSYSCAQAPSLPLCLPPPPRADGYSCAQRLSWGSCSQSWMITGHWCDVTCGRCKPCTDTVPSGAAPTAASACTLKITCMQHNQCNCWFLLRICLCLLCLFPAQVALSSLRVFRNVLRCGDPCRLPMLTVWS